MQITHAKVSTVEDGPDPDEVQPSDWNDDHVITGLGGDVLVAEATLLNADLLAIGSTHFEIIPAQGVGTVICVLQAWAMFEAGSTQFDTNGANPTIGYGNGMNPFNGVLYVEGLNSENHFQPSFDLSITGAIALSEFANKALNVEGVGDLTGGVGNALKVFVAYTVIQL